MSVPDGVATAGFPVTMAVKVRGVPNVVVAGGDAIKLIDGVALERLIVTTADVALL